MWEKLSGQARPRRESALLLDWMRRQVLVEANWRQAEEVLARAIRRAGDFARYEFTPQSAPWHAEGPSVKNHVLRILCSLEAIEAGAALTQIEEFCREKNLQAEIIELEATIREHAATLAAYALLHDLGKITTISFEAPKASKGAELGFIQHHHRAQARASESERRYYFKLLSALHAKYPEYDHAELMAAFYDLYEIRVHYFDHARISASDKFSAARESVEDMFRLSERERNLLAFTIRHHMQVIEWFRRSADAARYELLRARAGKAGFDADDALDFQLAALFLDTALGSLSYQNGVFTSDLAPTLNLLRAEEQARPSRRAARRGAQQAAAQKAFRALLGEAGLAADELFALMHVPPSPKRGEIVAEVDALVRDPGRAIDFGEFTDELTPKINQARRLFDARRELMRE